jgi:hypothetical protein
MRVLPSAVLVFLLALAPAAASAVTVDQVVALSKAGVSEPIILALIERDKTVFTIDPEQLAALQRDGLSETIILAMLKSGRAEGEAAANAASELNTAFILSTLYPAPEIVIVGHDPMRPNGGYQNGIWPGRSVYDDFPLMVPYGVPYVSSYGGQGGRHGSRHVPMRSATQVFPPAILTPVPPPPSLSSPAVCIAHMTTSAAPPMVGSRGFVTVCPPGLR